MDYLRRGWCRRRVRARAVWCASAVFTAWIVLWRRPGDSLNNVMILMFMLASACTLSLSTRMGDYQEEQAKHAAASPRFDQMLGAVHEMADALTSARRDESALADILSSPGDSRLRLASPGEPRLRLIRSVGAGDADRDRRSTDRRGAVPPIQGA